MGWWRQAGFTWPGQWRELHLLWLPAVLVAVPLAGGVKALDAGALAILVTGYALTGLTEEGYLRGVMLVVLDRLTPRRAAFISAALFGAAHLGNVLFRGHPGLVAAQAIGASCFGVGYAALRLRTGTLWPLVVLHMLTDLFAAVARIPVIPGLVVQDVVLLGYGLWLLRSTRPARGSEPIRSSRKTPVPGGRATH